MDFPNKATFIQIYCQNLSGAKSKVKGINHQLMRTDFSIICLQETWFDESISNDEIVSFSKFSIYRQDRFSTGHHKSSGGGVCILVDGSLNSRQIIIEGVNILQYIAISFSLNGSTYIVVNIYVPFGTNNVSIVEYQKMLEQIKQIKCKQLVVCGDFNCPRIRWGYDDEIPGLMIPTSVDGGLEELFVECNAVAGLSQILEQPENRNHLDLAFCTDFDLAHCTFPVFDACLDYPSRFHAPFLINC